jgi:hypothetical protein
MFFGQGSRFRGFGFEVKGHEEGRARGMLSAGSPGMRRGVGFRV